MKFYVLARDGKPLGTLDAPNVDQARALAASMWGRVTVQSADSTSRWDRIFCAVQQTYADGHE